MKSKIEELEIPETWYIFNPDYLKYFDDPAQFPGFSGEGGVSNNDNSSPALQATKRRRRETIMNIENIARICHEANKVYCESIGDKSQPAWDDAPEWQKESAINGVRFHIEDPDAPPSSSHKSWLAEKVAAEEQQVKDHLFSAIVKGLSRFVSYQ